MALGLCPGGAGGLGERSPALLGMGHQLAGIPLAFSLIQSLSKIDRAHESIAIFSRVVKVVFSLLEGSWNWVSNAACDPTEARGAGC